MSVSADMLLNILNLGVVSALFTIVLQSLVGRAVIRWITQCQVALQKSLLWIWVLMPFSIAGLCCMVFVTNTFSEAIWEPIGLLLHWHHLFQFEWVSWHGALLIAFFGFTCWLIAKHLKQLSDNQKRLTLAIQLAGYSHSTLHGESVVCLHSDHPMAFSAGLITPKIYLSSGMVDRLSEQQLACVLEHEAQHCRSFDPLMSWVFCFVSGFQIKPVRKRLRTAYNIACELIADKRAAEQYDPLNVAQTLVSVSRFNSNCHMKFGTGFGYEFVEQRVNTLLQTTPERTSGLVWVGALTTAIVGLNLVSIDSLHHYVELILSL